MSQDRGIFTDVMSSGAGAFSDLFGSQVGDQDGWMHERGSALGQELMAKMMGNLYSTSGLEQPADATRSRALTSEDIVASSGLGDGKMAHLLKPLIDGLVSCMQSAGVQQQLTAFAHSKTTQLLGQHSDALGLEGERLGNTFVEHLATALGAENLEVKIEEASRDLGDMQPQGPVFQQDRGLGDSDRGLASDIVNLVVGPVAKGLKATFLTGGTANRIMDAVMSAVPLDKVKAAMKGNLLPHYENACRSVSPQLESYGGKAGMQLIEFLQNISTGKAESTEESQRELAGSISRDEASVDHVLMSPVFDPFMRGMIERMAAGGWKTEAAMNMFKSILKF